MDKQHITVVYQWTAKEGKFDDLRAIYEQVSRDMEQNEPDAKEVQCYENKADGTLFVRDEFANGQALGLHLGTTARAHFPKLLEIATPGAFFFFGEVPGEIKAGVEQMGLNAHYGAPAFGFTR